jgi:FecR protein
MPGLPCGAGDTGGRGDVFAAAGIGKSSHSAIPFGPASLLGQYPVGGATMIARVRDLIASDPATLKPVVDLLATATENQATAIGSGLGQAAMMALKTDQALANQIQEAIVNAGHAAPKAGELNVSAQPKIGSAVTTKNQVDGVTERGTHHISEGTGVYLNELVRTGTSGMAQLLFADHTNLTVAPVTEIRLDRFVYDPAAKSGNVVVVAVEGAFRFITGHLPSHNYSLSTPFATLGVRGTEFIVVIKSNEEQIQLNKGKVIVTTISNKVVTLDTPNTVLLVDSHGNTQGPKPLNQPLVNFADLGAPVTNSAFADAQSAFAAVTGNSTIGANGGPGGGSGGGGEAPTGQTAGGIGGFGGGGAGPNLSTAVTSPKNLPALNSPLFSGGSPGGISRSVSPH